MEENSTQKSGSRSWTPIAVVLAILLVAGGAYWYLEQEGEGATITEEPNADEAAVIVDGTEIDRATLDRSIEQITGTYTAQGIDTSSAEAAEAIRQQAITALVNRQLMIGAAMEAGVEVDDAAVDAEYQNALTNVGGEENLAAALSGIGMNESDLRADIEKDVMINQYLEEKLDLDSLTVTDEEVQTAYDTATEASTEEVPPLEEVAELIRNQLLIEKQQQLINTELERLRAEAEIEILV